MAENHANPVVHFLTSNWADKMMALFLAFVIFWVVDDRITQKHEVAFNVTFKESSPREHTLFVQLRDGYVGELLSANELNVTFKGPRQYIQRIKGLPVIRATINHEGTDFDGAEVSLPASNIQFSDIDPDAVTIQADDLLFRVYSSEERSVDVSPVITAADFVIPDGFQIGEPRPERQSVKVRFIKKHFNFNTIDLRPDSDAFGGKRLEPGDNRVPFKVEPPNHAKVHFFETDLPPGEPIFVTIPVVAKLQKSEIEVRIDLVLPSDGSIARPVRAEKPRETFVFIGPEETLEKLKKLERSNDEIRARVDLSRLTAAERKLLEEGQGLSLRPTFVYPSFVRDVRCERAKVIWVRYAKEGSQ